MHLSFTAETLDIGLEMTLIGADRAPQGVVVLKSGAEPERQDRGEFEAVCDNASVVFGGLLIKLFTIFGGMLGDDDGEITSWEEECLMTGDARNSCKGHWTAMPGKFREGLTFCDAIGVPCHDFYLPSCAEGSNRPIRKFVLDSYHVRRICRSYSFSIVLSSANTQFSLSLTEPKRIVFLLEDSWQHFLAE